MRLVFELAAKILYNCLLIIGPFCGVAIALRFHSLPLAVVSVVSFAGLPWLLHQLLPTDLRNAAACLKREDFDGAQVHARRFLDQLRRWPGMNNLIGLSMPLGASQPKVRALIILGQAARGKGALDEAETHLTAALQIEPQSLKANLVMGAIHFDRSQWKAGKARFAKVASAKHYRADKELIQLARMLADGPPEYREIVNSATRPMEVPDEGNVQLQLLDDDATPMEFVVAVLEEVIGLTREEAVRLMLAIDENGSALCGAFQRQAAEAKAEAILARAREAGHPLQLRLVAKTGV